MDARQSLHHLDEICEDQRACIQDWIDALVQSHRANDIMRVLTVLTAVFLSLSLIAGIFGMNFEFIPLVHKADGFWITMASMGLIAVALVVVFWRKRYLARTR